MANFVFGEYDKEIQWLIIGRLIGLDKLRKPKCISVEKHMSETNEREQNHEAGLW